VTPRAVTAGGGVGGGAGGAGGVGGAGAAWVVPAAGGALVAAGGALWVAGGLASLLAGGGWRSAPFGIFFAVRVARDGPGAYWPAARPGLVWGLAAALAALVLVPVGVLVLRWALSRPRSDEPLRSLATLADVRHLTAPPAAEAARRLRPSLSGTPAKEMPAGDAGLVLGRLLRPGRRPGPRLSAGWEDVLLAFMAPRAGKTTSYVVPLALSAPGAVVLTSNKADAWTATAELRRKQTGQRVWTFDPQHIAHAAQSWWWNPLAGLDTVEGAERLAGHFVLTVEDERSKDIWGPAAQELLAGLLLAAKTSGGSMSDVYDWLSDEATPVPAQLLRTGGLRHRRVSGGHPGQPPGDQGQRLLHRQGRRPMPAQPADHRLGHPAAGRHRAGRVRRRRIPCLAADAVPAVQGRRRVRGAAGRRPHRPGDARRCGLRRTGRRPARPADAGPFGRGRQHLPDR